jgi:hypothetical protein
MIVSKLTTRRNIEFNYHHLIKQHTNVVQPHPSSFHSNLVPSIVISLRVRAAQQSNNLLFPLITEKRSEPHTCLLKRRQRCLPIVVKCLLALRPTFHQKPRPSVFNVSAAKCNSVFPSISLSLRPSGQVSTNNRTTSVSPLPTADCNGVCPSRFFSLTASGQPSTNNPTTAACA